MRLKGKVALVSGASKGMGAEIAHLFAREGAIVVAGDIVEPVKPHAEGVEHYRLDVTKEEDWANIIEATLQKHGRVDILINNAGILAYEPIDSCSLDAWHKMIAVNQTGVFLGMRAVLKPMRKQKSGSIVNFSSIWGNTSVEGAHAYHASKGAVRNMTKNAAVTYGPEGIRTNSVHPGLIETPMTEHQDADLNASLIAATPLKRIGKPIDVANGVLFLASDEASYVNGAELAIDGGYLAR
ncbi:glucose 1-dehydrogenase [Burkholderia sp. Ac-20353]|nr:glucose 1-dehydrogenase [Burkholderia sp. Ac-20353]